MKSLVVIQVTVLGQVQVLIQALNQERSIRKRNAINVGMMKK